MYQLLVVDDETETRTSLCNYFPWEQFGFQVIAEKENGKQALEYLLQHTVDVLLCDIRMPVMDGLELLEQLAARHIQPIIIILTGMRDVAYARQVIQIGTAYDYLLKPTKYEEFAAVFSTIKKELDRQNIQSQVLPAELSQTRNQRIIEQIREYSREHCATITLEDIGELVHMNPNYVSQFFKEHSGENFSDFLLKIKMEKASVLLEKLHYRIYEVSEMVGYGSPRNFTRAFKNYFGKTPREYQSSGGNHET